MYAMENDPYQLHRNPSVFTSEQNATSEISLKLVTHLCLKSQFDRFGLWADSEAFKDIYPSIDKAVCQTLPLMKPYCEQFVDDSRKQGVPTLQ